MFGLSIERCETGFLVYEKTHDYLLAKKWAFETPEALAKFIKEWAEEDNE